MNKSIEPESIKNELMAIVAKLKTSETTYNDAFNEAIIAYEYGEEWCDWRIDECNKVILKTLTKARDDYEQLLRFICSDEKIVFSLEEAKDSLNKKKDDFLLINDVKDEQHSNIPRKQEEYIQEERAS